MLWLLSAMALANLTLDPPAGAKVAPERQARAVVRIVRPVRLQDALREEGVLRSSVIRDEHGSDTPVSLIEFY